METARCKAFLYSVENGSFSKAAEALGYTPSGVSQLVSALENELGMPLLIRSKKGVILTANGESILPTVREFLAEEDKLHQIAADIQGLVIGNITIATYSSIATHWLPDVIKEFQTQYPKIKIKLLEGIRQEVVQWIDNRQADIGFLSYLEPMPYDWLPLAEDQMLAVLPRDHPFANATSYPLKNCTSENFIMPGKGQDADVIAMFERNDIFPNIAFSTIENFAALAMIESGLGISIMNELITQNWVCDVSMMPVEPPQKITLGLAVPSLGSASPAVKRFIDFAVARLTRKEVPL